MSRTRTGFFLLFTWLLIITLIHVSTASPQTGLKTGTLLYGAIPNEGASSIVLDNNNNKDDAIVVLTNPGSSSPLCALYVRKGTSYTLPGLTSGEYNIYVELGTDYDESSKSFSNPEYYMLAGSSGKDPRIYRVASSVSQTGTIYGCATEDCTPEEIISAVRDDRIIVKKQTIPGGMKVYLRQIKMGKLNADKIGKSQFPT
ncbi:MAG: hypothetical protein LUQ50_10885 [Methanospirillum sp.]|uniref:hypothetical protein n=1 Tax=Methanospirillum sp. TaxID=45200 RepID=UPI00236A8AEF|nr:hypothetical protein [Methanospirillum sp.]MDD1729561.1 hypothetical protein [Methanospirillum sp.]